MRTNLADSPALGVCYYPEQWPPARWAADAKAMAELGLSVVRIGEFAWSRMQPEPDRFDWAWLDDAVRVLGEAGLGIVMGTPTAAPPRWLIERHPDILPVDANGGRKSFGSRRHADLSNDDYLEASRVIVDAMARRYGSHDCVIAWQVDNEFGCHDTGVSYSPAAVARFRRWLERRHGDIAALNAAWGNVFWSMEYTGFEQIGAPVRMPAQANPIHALDYRRFASDEIVRFNRMQVDLLREHSPGRPVLHNFMAFFAAFDHHALARDLDIVGWDNYPLGACDVCTWMPAQERLRHARTGHPDFAAFHHDLYRGMAPGRLWVMEQQAGPVNWAHANPSPLPGMVRAWTWEAIAHGAELVSYFRWRQLPYAQEQMHSGLRTPDDRPDAGSAEVREVATQLRALALPPAGKATVALVFDYESQWMIDLQPHGAGFDYHALVFGFYTSLRRLGLDVDIVPASADFDDRALVVVPTLAVVDDDFVRRVESSPATFVFGPRTGSKTPRFAVPEGLPPGPLARLLPMRVWRVESLPAQASQAIFVDGRSVGESTRWRDFVEADPGAQVVARYDDHHPAWLRHGRLHVVTGCLDHALLRRVLDEAAQAAGLSVQPLPEGLRLRRRGDVLFAFNFGPGTVDVPAPAGARFLLGDRTLAPAGVAAWSTR